MRQVYAVLGLVKKCGPQRVEAACASVLEHEAGNVGLIGRMLERATETTRAAPPASAGTVVAATEGAAAEIGVSLAVGARCFRHAGE